MVTENVPRTIMVTENAHVINVDALTHRERVLPSMGENMPEMWPTKPFLKLLPNGTEEGAHCAVFEMRGVWRGDME